MSEFICELCGQNFGSRSDAPSLLSAHMQTHISELLQNIEVVLIIGIAVIAVSVIASAFIRRKARV